MPFQPNIIVIIIPIIIIIIIILICDKYKPTIYDYKWCVK